MTFESKSKIQQRKRVSFDPRVSVKRVLHKKNYTAEEIQASWYDSSDFECIRDDAAQMIRWMEESGLHSTMIKRGYYCVRGLETFTKDGLQQKLQSRFEAWETVFEEQEFQMNNGLNEPESLALLYKRCCKASQREARAIAQKDAAAVGYYRKKTGSNDTQYSNQKSCTHTSQESTKQHSVRCNHDESISIMPVSVCFR